VAARETHRIRRWSFTEVLVLTCNGLETTIVGTTGPDILVGTSERDVIVGLTGDDVIYGLGGNDVICGGEGNDVILGGDGKALWGGWRRYAPRGSG
jgi:Ca2+-binding RTX toxin-like protein